MIMNISPRLLRLILNLYPPYCGTGIHIDRIAADWTSVDVSMKLRWYNRNAVGTQFGGSLYAMVDSHLMLMLMRLLGDGYIVWDKSASIDFLRPGRGRVSAHLAVKAEDVHAIHTELEKKSKVLPEFTVTIVDAEGMAVASVKKVLYVRKKARAGGDAT